MNPQPQPLVSICRPTTRYGASSFRIRDLEQPRPGQSPYFETDKLRAMAVYAETGNASEAARQIGADHQTVQAWVNAEGSDSLIAELRSTVRYNEGWRLSRLVSRSLDKLEESLERGDPITLKDGRVVYRPQAYRDLVVGTSILIDKWMLISGAISSETHLLGRMDDLSKQLTVMGGALKASAPSSPPDGTPIGDHPGENLIG